MATAHQGGKLAQLQDAGLIARNHKLDPRDIEALSSLSDGEIAVLKDIKNKLGESFLRKTAKDEVFPHPMSLSF